MRAAPRSLTDNLPGGTATTRSLSRPTGVATPASGNEDVHGIALEPHSERVHRCDACLVEELKLRGIDRG